MHRSLLHSTLAAARLHQAMFLRFGIAAVVFAAPGGNFEVRPMGWA